MERNPRYPLLGTKIYPFKPAHLKMVIFLFVQVGYVGSLEGRQIGVVLDTIAPTGNILGFACFGWL